MERIPRPQLRKVMDIYTNRKRNAPVLEKTASGQEVLKSGVEEQLQSASKEIRNLWLDIGKAIRMIDEGQHKAAARMLKKARLGSEIVTKKEGF